MITTSQFSQEARDYVRRIEKKIVLIDGKELAELMIDHGIGVTEVAAYSIKKVNSDYFEEQETAFFNGLAPLPFVSLFGVGIPLQAVFARTPQAAGFLVTEAASWLARRTARLRPAAQQRGSSGKA